MSKKVGRPNPPAEKQLDPNSGKVVVTTQSVAWQGPLPPPAALAQFDEIVPGSARTILGEWQAETAHRRELEQKALGAEIAERKLSRWQAFSFAMAALIGAGFCAYIDQPTVAGILGGSTILGVVATFVLNKRQPPEG